jgi:hypothetical protein
MNARTPGFLSVRARLVRRRLVHQQARALRRKLVPYAFQIDDIKQTKLRFRALIQGTNHKITKYKHASRRDILDYLS